MITPDNIITLIITKQILLDTNLRLSEKYWVRIARKDIWKNENAECIEWASKQQNLNIKSKINQLEIMQKRCRACPLWKRVVGRTSELSEMFTAFCHSFWKMIRSKTIVAISVTLCTYQWCGYDYLIRNLNNIHLNKYVV